jgi:T5orf172 domain
MPKLYKVGQTGDHPEVRLQQLNTTGVPTSFLLEFCFRVDDPTAVEKKIHQGLSQFRYSVNREFFEIEMNRLQEIVFPIIRAHPVASGAATTVSTKKQHTFSDVEIFVLQLLVSSGGRYGVQQFRLESRVTCSSLELDIALANLHSAKLIGRKSSSHQTEWKTLPRGTKFLVDHGLIEEWMNNSYV